MISGAAWRPIHRFSSDLFSREGCWGYSTFNDLTGLDQRGQEACESARLVGRERTLLAPLDPVVHTNRAVLGKDFRQVPLAEKKALTEEYNRIILGFSPKIQTSNTGYSDEMRKIVFASSDGAYIEDEQPGIHIFCVAITRDGDLVQQVWETEGDVEGYQ